MKRNLIYSGLLAIAAIALTVSACSEDSFSGVESGSDSGKGGSMARFTIAGDYLYTVDHSTLKMFSVSDPAHPQYLREKEQNLDVGIETIFVMDTLLFIGSQDGMYIYNIKRPAFPQFTSMTSHIRSCDPVVASGNYAYVTLNSDNRWCGRASNVLQIYNISDPYRPVLVEPEMRLNSPRGLGIDGNKLFVCDRGLKVYDVSNPERPLWIDDPSEIPEAGGVDAYDVIPYNGILLLTGKDGLYQFDYTGERLAFVSKIPVNR